MSSSSPAAHSPSSCSLTAGETTKSFRVDWYGGLLYCASPEHSDRVPRQAAPGEIVRGQLTEDGRFLRVHVHARENTDADCSSLYLPVRDASGKMQVLVEVGPREQGLAADKTSETSRYPSLLLASVRKYIPDNVCNIFSKTEDTFTPVEEGVARTTPMRTMIRANNSSPTSTVMVQENYAASFTGRPPASIPAKAPGITGNTGDEASGIRITANARDEASGITANARDEASGVTANARDEVSPEIMATTGEAPTVTRIAANSRDEVSPETGANVTNSTVSQGMDGQDAGHELFYPRSQGSGHQIQQQEQQARSSLNDKDNEAATFPETTSTQEQTSTTSTLMWSPRVLSFPGCLGQAGLRTICATGGLLVGATRTHLGRQGFSLTSVRMQQELLQHARLWGPRVGGGVGLACFSICPMEQIHGCRSPLHDFVAGSVTFSALFHLRIFVMPAALEHGLLLGSVPGLSSIVAGSLGGALFAVTKGLDMAIYNNFGISGDIEDDTKRIRQWTGRAV
ncbi:unnamed protein product [Amoebophrya sp. A25]|nr:unnamed protein product [Amoebophrya sp. A25]|eukprot:GSA25T00018106001.1